MAKDNGKVVAILSYITIIGWIIAIIMHGGNKTKLGSFHLRQALIIYIAGIVLSWIPFLGFILGIVLFIFWLVGLIAAIKGEEKEIPIIGSLGQKWFKGI